MSETIVICSKCYDEVGPVSQEFLRNLACVEERIGNVSFWDCPRCGKTIYEVYDFGEIEFGMPTEGDADVPEA